MMPLDFPEYAALWREQIDPTELAELREMATKIKRTAGRKWLLDRVLALFAVSAICWVLLLSPASPPIRLCLVLLLLLPAWALWRRYQLTKAARAIAVDDPRLFFDAAIENARAEIKLSSLAGWSGIPWFLFSYLLAGAANNHLDTNIRDLLTLGSAKFIFASVIIILAFIYLIRDKKRFREQLRRLEAMRREWEERDPGGEP